MIKALAITTLLSVLALSILTGYKVYTYNPVIVTIERLTIIDDDVAAQFAPAANDEPVSPWERQALEKVKELY